MVSDFACLSYLFNGVFGLASVGFVVLPIDTLVLDGCVSCSPRLLDLVVTMVAQECDAHKVG